MTEEGLLEGEEGTGKKLRKKKAAKDRHITFTNFTVRRDKFFTIG
jgi:hypothetical protein